MAETANIARIAEKVADEIFGVFGWERATSRDLNWPCAMSESHLKATHPSDVVFYYDDPYVADRVYVTTDLKSYARGTIQRPKVSGAIRSLAMTTSCANVSPDFERLYVPDLNRPSRVAGMLFIYNHDGAYSGDFATLFKELKFDDLPLSAPQRVYVLGPYEIEYLYNVARDIASLRGLQKIPMPEHCSFFNPDMVRAMTVAGHDSKAASLEWLTGPWQMLRFTRADGKAAIHYTYVYYRGPCTEAAEFKYLFDFLFRYQLIDTGTAIEVRTVKPAADAAAIFEKAKIEYATFSHPSASTDFANRLKQVRFSTMEATYARFSEIEIGMRDD